ncbi:MAG: Gfo/Idh/MocA family oxidoreductase [Clostridia bacterium]|nr:Gfo/Idh/MocA family oxidoreductase [Clostridia bacterium]
MADFAVIGIGRMGGQHARNLAAGRMKGSRLVAVCDIDKEKVDKFCKKHPSVKGFYDHKSLIESGVCKAVMIAVPHYFHGQIAKDCIKAGLHTVVEKPLTVTTLEAKSVIETAKKHPDVYFGMMFNQRTNRMYRKAKELIESGAIGKIQRANYVITDWYRSQAYYNQGGWRASWSGEGGGTLINQCVHQLDLVQWLLGMPERITSSCRTVGRNISTENDLYAVFGYKDFDCYFCASTHELPGENRFTIVGTKGTIVITSWKMTYTILKKSEPQVNAETTQGYGSTPMRTYRYGYGLIRKTVDLIYGQQWRVIEAFGKAVDSKNKDVMIAPGEEGLRSLTLINGIYLSNWRKETVSLPFDDEEYAKLLKEKADAEKKEK